MRTIAKPFLSATALLLLILLGPALLLNLWLLLPGSRAQVLGSIGTATQSPVTVSGLYAVPLLGNEVEDQAREVPCGESWFNAMASILTYALRQSKGRPKRVKYASSRSIVWSSVKAIVVSSRE